MKKNIKIFIIVFLLLFSINNDVKAFTLLSKGAINYGTTGSTLIYTKDENGNYGEFVFCVQHGYAPPNKQGNDVYSECSTKITYDDKGIYAALGYAINWFKNNGEYAQSTHNYYGITNVIWSIVEKYAPSTQNDVQDNNLKLTNTKTDEKDASGLYNLYNGGDYTDIFNNAVNEHDYYNRTTLQLSGTQLTFEYDSSTGNYISNSIRITNQVPGDVISYELTLNGNQVSSDYVKTYNDGYLWYFLSIPKSELSSGNNTISLKLIATRNYYLATEHYDCVQTCIRCTAKNVQDIIVATPTTELKSINETSSGTISYNPNATINIFKAKKDASGKNVAVSSKYVKFGVYTDSSCNNLKIESNELYTGGNGKISFSIPPTSNNEQYWIKETYISDTDNYTVSDECKYIGSLFAGESSTEITYLNGTTCVHDFENALNKYTTGEYTESEFIKERIRLFQEEYPNSNNLLNFTNNQADVVCSSYEPSYYTDYTCFPVAISQNYEFNSLNLSGYNDTIQVDGQNIGFCLTQYFIYESDTLSKIYDMPSIKTGTPIVLNEDNPHALNGILTKTCYVYGANTGEQIEDIMTYDDYVESIEIDDKILLKDGTNTSNKIKLSLKGSDDNGLKKYEAEIKVEYYFKPLYVKKISGKECNSDNPDNNCSFIGYGILSKFSELKNKQYNSSYLDMGINFKNLLSKNPSYSGNILEDSYGSCSYDIIEEIITYNNNPNGKLELEFRSIDTNNPFNRDTNSNWCSDSSCESNNSIVEQYILDSNNSYNKTNSDSLYTNQADGTKKIILTPDLVKKIRTYNETHAYDDYELTCDKNGNCSNAFLSEFDILKSS